MKWRKIEEMDFKVTVDEYQKDKRIGDIVLAAKPHNEGETPSVVCDCLLCRKFKSMSDVPKYQVFWFGDGIGKIIESRNGEVLIFFFENSTHFEDVIAYMFVSDMLGELENE